ncbi:MAG: apolipoprotein N-acyltransferase [Gammaproteobacteria bacterium]|nr:apolipoprotein N-acyltransferase [Gammaproteobacteria bacterium]
MPLILEKLIEFKLLLNKKVFLLFLSAAIYPLAFSPINLKFLSYISISVFIILLLRSNRKESIRLSFFYGFILYFVGVSWVFNSIYNFGGENLFSSVLITLIFILTLAATFIPIGFFINKSLKLSPTKSSLLISSLWIACEFIRSNLFGGFPWLIIGHSQIHTIFDNFFPILGSYFVGFIVIVLSSFFSIILIQNLNKKYFIQLFVAAATLFIINLIPIHWTKHSNENINFAVIQANIHQGLKFDTSLTEKIKYKYQKMSEQHSDKDLIVWPETAIPELIGNHQYLNKLKENYNESLLISGIFRFDLSSNKIFNSIVFLKESMQFYDKRHLVPFGEYIPLKDFIKPLGKLLDVPMSDISEGNRNQSFIKFKNYNIYPLICYEIAYPDLIYTNKDEYGLILNLSNDGWFGDSFAPHQHLQIAQIRAIETQSYILRAANTGISAVINPTGKINNFIPLNEEGVLTGNIFTTKFLTPYMVFGDYPILMLIFLLIFLHIYRFKRNG